MRTSYHNHTLHSDGKSTVGEMIAGARRAGLEELGISDHFALTADGRRFPWALPPESLEGYVDEVLRARESSGGLTIRLGLEIDYFPGMADRVGELLEPYPFDFLIHSVHFVDGFAIDLNAGPWEGLPQDERDRVWRTYWEYLRAAAATGLGDIIGHFDLPKKFNYYPSVDLTAEALAALDAVAAAGMAIEINCAGWDKPVKEAYPAPFYVREARRRGIPLVITADAHEAGDVARHFDRARLLAADAGYTELVRFERRTRVPCPL